MGLSKKDRRYILKNHPAMSVEELAKAVGAKPAEVRDILGSGGRKSGGDEAPASPVLFPGRANVIGIMMLVAAVSVVFLNSTRNGFHYDDIHSLLQNTGVMIDPKKDPDSKGLYWRYFKDPSLFSSRPGVAMPRPVLMCTFGFNYMVSAMRCDALDARLTRCEKTAKDEAACARERAEAKSCTRGYDARGWILLNVIIHLINVLILYVGLCHVSGRPKIALIAALLFAVHPINTETVNYINCRSESLGVMFMLLSMYFFSRALLADNTLKTAIFGAAFALAYVIGLLSKEMVFVTIALLALLDGLFIFPTTRGRDPINRHLIVRAGLYGFTILAMIGYMIYRNEVLNTLVVKSPVRPFMDNLVTQSGVLLSYVRLLFLPFHQNISYENEAILHTWKGLADPFFGSRLLFFMAIFAGGVADGYLGWRRKRPAVAALAVGLFFITLSVTSLVPLNALMNEHRLYLVSVGPCLLIAAVLAKTAAYIQERRQSDRAVWPWEVQVITLTILLAYAALTVQRNFTWHTDLTVWRDSIRNSPTKAQVVSDLGNAYFRGGGALAERGDAASDNVIDRKEKLVIAQTFRTSVPEGAISPETRKVLDGLYLKGLQRAEQLYRWGIRVERSYYKAWHNLGTINFTFSMVERDRARARFGELKKIAAEVEEMDRKAASAAKQAERLEAEARGVEEESAKARAEGRTADAAKLAGQAAEKKDQAAKARADSEALRAQVARDTEEAVKVRDEIIRDEEKAEEKLNFAVTYFQNATAISANGESFNDWASCLINLIDIESEKAKIQMRPEDKDKINKLGREAVDLYAKAVKYNPELPKGYVNYCTNRERFAASDLERKDTWRMCEPLLDKAINVAPLDPRPRWLKGDFQTKLMMYNEAAETFKLCLQVSPGYAGCANGLENLKR